MKEGLLGAAPGMLIPSHYQLLRSKAVVVSVVAMLEIFPSRPWASRFVSVLGSSVNFGITGWFVSGFQRHI